MKAPSLSFSKFLSAFPEHELPVSLTDESVLEFERQNDPLPEILVDAYVEAQEGEEYELIDYVPCFSLPATHDFHAVVLWRGDVLKHEYILITFDKEGNLIASSTLAGMRVDGDSILRSVATIEENWMIHVVEGTQNSSDKHYSPTTTSTYQMELLATGEIVVHSQPEE